MSAMAGIISFDGKKVERTTIERMASILKPFGQDRLDFWLKEGAGLMHRLAIINPEDQYDRQPIVSQDGKLVLISDARIDNREELSVLLDIPHTESQFMSDSAFILRAFEHWGESCAKHLLGDFAFAAWDTTEKTLYLVRDFRGGRPLYWYQRDKLLAFASLPKPLFVLPGVSRDIDRERFAWLYTRLPDDGSENTLFKGINRVLPSHIKIFRDAKAKTKRYFDYSDLPDISYQRDEEYVEHALELLEKSVQCRLRCRQDGGIASLLSSGLDSTTVTATAAKLLGNNRLLTAYTAGSRKGFDGPVPKGKHANEQEGASSVASMYGNIVHKLVGQDGFNPLNDIAADARLRDGWIGHPSHCAWGKAIFDLAKEDNIKVLLKGDLGNFTLSYDGRTRMHTLLRQRQFFEWGKQARALIKHNRAGPKSLIMQSIWPWLPVNFWRLFSSIRHGVNLSVDSYTPVNPRLIANTRIVERARNMGLYDHFKPTGDHYYYRVTSGLCFRDLGDAYAHTLAAWNFEARDPLVDQRIVEFSLAIPEAQFLNNGITRRLIKQMTQNILPESVLGLNTIGLPTADWYIGMHENLGDIKYWLKKLSNSPEACELLDIDSMNRLYEKMPDLANTAWGEKNIIHTYYLKLIGGIAAGAFIMNVYPDNQ